MVLPISFQGITELVCKDSSVYQLRQLQVTCTQGSHCFRKDHQLHMKQIVAKSKKNCVEMVKIKIWAGFFIHFSMHFLENLGRSFRNLWSYYEILNHVALKHFLRKKPSIVFNLPFILYVVFTHCTLWLATCTHCHPVGLVGLNDLQAVNKTFRLQKQYVHVHDF